jgi:hypothetical protein
MPKISTNNALIEASRWLPEWYEGVESLRFNRLRIELHTGTVLTDKNLLSGFKWILDHSS